jgi:Flp pilus assembly protein TadD
VLSVAFSPDGKTALTGSWDRTARLWDVETGLPLGPPWLHPTAVMSAAFSPDGATVVTGSEGVALVRRRPAPLKGSVQEVVLWTQLLTGIELDSRGLVSVLDAPTWRQRRHLLEERGGPPPAPAGTPAQVLAWHRRQAEQSRQAGQSFAGLWHLQRLIAAEPARGDYRRARGHVYETLGAWDRCLDDLAGAAALQPADWQAWMARGHVYSLLRQWPAAATAYARAVEANPHEPELWCLYAGTVVLAGDVERYCQVCADMLARYRETKDVHTWYHLAQACSLAPRRAADPSVPLVFAQRAVGASPNFGWHLHTLGMAHYRAGQYGQAARRLRESLERDPEWKGRPLTWLALALAEHRLGHGVEARSWLKKANRWLAETAAQRPRETPGAYPLPVWTDQLEFALLCSEAQTAFPDRETQGADY